MKQITTDYTVMQLTITVAVADYWADDRQRSQEEKHELQSQNLIDALDQAVDGLILQWQATPINLIAGKSCE